MPGVKDNADQRTRLSLQEPLWVKYRDFVIVLCFVAGVVFWQAGPPGTSPKESPSPTIPDVVKQKVVTPEVTKETPEPKNRFSRIDSPDLELVLVKSEQDFEDLVFTCKLTATDLLDIPMESEKAPRVDLEFSVGDENWTLGSPSYRTAPDRKLKEGDSLSWNVAVQRLDKPADLDRLKDLYGKHRISVSAFIVEGNPDSNPFSRKLHRVIQGSVVLEPRRP
jgi:hypothetical protein